jgi:ubiquinone/menaquinone biosynthesis C-methylase UbiE
MLEFEAYAIIASMNKTAQPTDLMREDWNERAKNDAFYYIASWNEKWDPASFFLSGEHDYQVLAEPILAKGFDPTGKEMLEVGCGVGRMTQAFARRFARVHGLDISAEMLDQARRFHGNQENINWLLGDGSGFPMIASGTVDFVFSYITLQHVPTESLVLGYVQEIMRVLKPGGICLFQFNSRQQPTMNWKGRLVWSVIDHLREPILGMNFSKAGSRLALLLHLDPLSAGRTWRGAIVDVRTVLETVWSSGGLAGGISGWGEDMTWCSATKR